jgi:hypothetical protein
MTQEPTKREQALCELTQFLEELWKRPISATMPHWPGREWTRAELYERKSWSQKKEDPTGT